MYSQLLNCDFNKPKFNVWMDKEPEIDENLPSEKVINDLIIQRIKINDIINQSRTNNVIKYEDDDNDSDDDNNYNDNIDLLIFMGGLLISYVPIYFLFCPRSLRFLRFFR